MGQRTGIEWTDSTWNPVTGCSRVSEGCRNCYMARTVPRFGQDPWEVVLHPERLDTPLKWRAPKKIFVNSLSDLFHDDVPDSFIDACFGVMLRTPQHTYQILTKRPERMLKWATRDIGQIAESMAALAVTHPAAYKKNLTDKEMLSICDRGWPAPHVWLGVSIEDQQTADTRIPLLMRTPAAKRFISAEPLLDMVDLREHLWPLCYATREEHEQHHADGLWCDERGLDWVIVGGESGPGARPMHPDWARRIRDQCQDASVPFFFKQWGEYQPISTVDGVQSHPFGDYNVETRWGFAKIGKHHAGSMLDGKQWKEFPR